MYNTIAKTQYTTFEEFNSMVMHATKEINEYVKEKAATVLGKIKTIAAKTAVTGGSIALLFAIFAGCFYAVDALNLSDIWQGVVLLCTTPLWALSSLPMVYFSNLWEDSYVNRH